MNDKILTIKKSTLVDIANEVRAKTGSTELIKVADLDDAVANLQGGGGGGIVEVDTLPSPIIPDPNSIGPVPNTGHVGTVCFNTSLTNDEVKAELEKLTYIVADESTGIEMSSLLTAVNSEGEMTFMIIVMRVFTEYMIVYTSMDNQAESYIWATDALGASNGFTGWHYDFNGVLEVNGTAISEGGLLDPTAPNGADNDKIVNLFYTCEMAPNPEFNAEAIYKLPDGTLWMYLDNKFVEMDEKIIPSNYGSLNNNKMGFYYGQTFTIDDPISIDASIITEYLSDKYGQHWYVSGGAEPISLIVPLYDIAKERFYHDMLKISFSINYTGDGKPDYCNMELQDSFSEHSIDHTYEIGLDSVHTFTLRELYNNIYGKNIVDRFPITHGIVVWDCSNGIRLTETVMVSSGDLNSISGPISVYKCLKIGK